METPLSARLKNLILAGLAVTLAAAILGIAVLTPADWTSAKVRARVEKNCERMDSVLAAKVKKYIARSDELGGRFRAGTLTAAGFEKKEALITEKNGIITDYVGEIYFFRPVTLAAGEWRLIEKNQEVYFLRRIGPQAIYVCFFMDMRANAIRQ